MIQNNPVGRGLSEGKDETRLALGGGGGHMEVNFTNLSNFVYVWKFLLYVFQKDLKLKGEVNTA